MATEKITSNHESSTSILYIPTLTSKEDADMTPGILGYQ